MDVDSLSIVSMNSSRKGLFSLSPSQRTSYLESILANGKPDLCFLSGDNGETGKDVVAGYGQYMSQSNNQTVLLYKPERMRMSHPSFSFNSFGCLPLLSYEDIVCPLVSVETMAPTPKRVIKQFSVISWRYQMCQRAGDKTEQKKLSESLVVFAQRVAQTTNLPVLVCGEFPSAFNEVMSIVKDQTRLLKTDFVHEWQEELGPRGYLPSMTKSATKGLRHFELKGFHCKTDYTRGQEPQVSDFFLASKELDLQEPTFMNVEELTGRKIKMKSLQNFRPTSTKIEIPTRPPKHHGG